jgi:hypothetical protein
VYTLPLYIYIHYIHTHTICTYYTWVHPIKDMHPTNLTRLGPADRPSQPAATRTASACNPVEPPLEPAFFKGKVICYLCELKQLLTRFFSSPISPSSPTPASYSGEFRVRVRVPGLGFGVSGVGLLFPLDLEGGPAAAGRPGGGRRWVGR